jgi:hypothetical protein
MAKTYEKQDYDGKVFDSKSEVEFYKELIKAVDDNRIKSFECNPKYILFEGDWLNWRNDKQVPILHYPDYKIVLNDNKEIIVDTKGGGTKTHESDAILKKKIFEYLNRSIPYYYISCTPKFLGDVWVESSTYHDFYTKLKNKYKKVFPNENPKDWRNCKKFLPVDWGQYYDFEIIGGLFYIFHKEYTKKELEKMSKEKSS